MKKSIIFALLVIGAMLLTACGPKVKQEDAKSIAVKDAGQDISGVSFTSTSMETVNGVTTYQFTFGNDAGEWEYTLDGDGNITSSKETIYANETEAPTEAETAAQEATETEPETDMSVDPYYSVMEYTGEVLDNPVFDPYNAFGNVGIDQERFIEEIRGSEYYDFFDHEDDDLYIYNNGLKRFVTDSDESFVQLWMNNGSTVPSKISYVDAYSDKEHYLDDYFYLASLLEDEFGTPADVGLVDTNGEVSHFSMDDVRKDLSSIDETDGGYVFVTYNSGGPYVSLNTNYDPESKIFRIYLDFEE